MIKTFLETGPGHLKARVGALPLGGDADEGVDHQVVDWAMGGLPDAAARDVEARVHGYLQEAADLGSALAKRQCVLWLVACVPVLLLIGLLFKFT
ncbi:hypothetical protein GCM10022243_54610 [Saccharothrix violaceirubra]|uniref:Uncharacterized protein n=1 Tax=Saccharothrix violaceirubra TaxID=413306 RepID=A0A7W7T5I3_9PSEU|nr:hypothetical protein [Saccharothrix violaceirubra]MBB4966974.1 hypothetical protein [Saccharothrix violaceirubra]